ncbi:MAG: Na+/H+ antiporter NhaA [Pedobacter sp.]|nr:MAG: Na+/H+ antiporter NhaA [Pedobacter sp.]
MGSLIKPFNRFIKSEYTGGIILFLATLIAMIWANSAYRETYFHLWEHKFTIGVDRFILSKSLHHWINDGLMAIFFFVIGLELKREFIAGELSSIRKSILPIVAAIGGMIVPALIYMFFNKGMASSSGWGIPMATDIAFAIGILSLAGKSIPFGLKVFLTALAIVDDLGAVLVIAFFYTSQISIINLSIGIFFLAILALANRLGVRNIAFYGLLGIGGVWLTFLLSGVHATIAGVLVAFTIPAKTKIDENKFISDLEILNNDFKLADPDNSNLITTNQLHLLDSMKKLILNAETPLQRLEHNMHPLVTFMIMPIFALANAGIEIRGDFFASLNNSVSIGVIAGLLLGKFLGVVISSKIVVKTGIAELPENTTWGHIYGVALLAGIGFTMSLFVTDLAFESKEMVQNAKTGILLASLIAGILGISVLKFITRKKVL